MRCLHLVFAISPGFADLEANGKGWKNRLPPNGLPFSSKVGGQKRFAKDPLA